MTAYGEYTINPYVTAALSASLDTEIKHRMGLAFVVNYEPFVFFSNIARQDIDAGVKVYFLKKSLHIGLIAHFEETYIDKVGVIFGFSFSSEKVFNKVLEDLDPEPEPQKEEKSYEELYEELHDHLPAMPVAST